MVEQMHGRVAEWGKDIQVSEGSARDSHRPRSTTPAMRRLWATFWSAFA